jgi:hypothetical protein
MPLGNILDVKELLEQCAFAGVSPRRETLAFKPSLVVRGSVVIK